MSEWQSMNSAPKDRTPILANYPRNEDLCPVIIKWPTWQAPPTGWVNAWDNDPMEGWGEPDAWMPLPKTPHWQEWEDALDPRGLKPPAPAPSSAQPPTPGDPQAEGRP